MCCVGSKRQKVIWVLRFTLLGANISAPNGTFEDDCPIPKVGYVSFPGILWLFWAPRNPISCKVFVLPCRISRYQWGHCPRTKSHQLCFVRRSQNSTRSERQIRLVPVVLIWWLQRSIACQRKCQALVWVSLLAIQRREIYVQDCVFFFEGQFLVNIDQINALTTSPPWGWTDNLILATDSYKYRSFACDFRHARQMCQSTKIFRRIDDSSSFTGKKPKFPSKSRSCMYMIV